MGRSFSALMLSGALSASVPAAAQEPATASAEAAKSPGAEALTECDQLWARRADGSNGGSAPAAGIDRVIAACRKAASEAPGSLEARWRLMRALYFKGEYTTKDKEEQKRIFDDGKKVGEEALGLIRRAAAEAAGKPMDKASPLELVPAVKRNRAALSCFLWAAVDWGKWALVFGKTAAVRQGAAAKIRDYSKAVIAADPAFEDAGGYRVLGRLHHQTPAVPFFTGWASRDEALKNLREAVRLAPKHFINRQYLAEAMWDYEKSKRPEARAMLESLIADTPSADYLVEDRKTQEEARALLSTWKAP